MFSKSCQYALQAVLYIGLKTREKNAVGLKEIAESQSIPHHFLSKILQELVKRKILISTKGPNGGFSFFIPPEKLYLMKIVEIIDGTDIFDRCGLGLKKCSDQTPCPVHAKFKLVKADIKALLTTKSVAELSEDVKNGLAIISI
jgi:Rrf2 family transcriptional regulator, iron-sulfur cluster assembly transcription factor